MHACAGGDDADVSATLAQCVEPNIKFLDVGNCGAAVNASLQNISNLAGKSFAPLPGCSFELELTVLNCDCPHKARDKPTRACVQSLLQTSQVLQCIASGS